MISLVLKIYSLELLTKVMEDEKINEGFEPKVNT